MQVETARRPVLRLVPGTIVDLTRKREVPIKRTQVEIRVSPPAVSFINNGEEEPDYSRYTVAEVVEADGPALNDRPGSRQDNSLAYKKDYQRHRCWKRHRRNRWSKFTFVSTT